MLVLKSELGSENLLNRVELYSTHASQATGVFYNVAVFMCETDVSSLSTSFNANYGGGVPVEVFSIDTLSIDWAHASPGWNGFDLDTPFQYSGTENLIVEFRYQGHNGKTVNARAASLPSADRCLSGAYPTSTSGQLMSFLTCMRLHFAPSGFRGASFGMVKAFFAVP